MNAKESFVFYIAHYEAIKDLNNEQLGRLFRALFEKQLGNEVVLENDIKIAFNFINNQMVIDNEKYLKKCEKLRENAKKGGAPKGNKNAQKQPKQPNCKKNNLNDNDNDNDNVNVNENVNENENDNVNENENENDNDNDSNNNNLFDFIENNFGRTLNQIEYEEINTWEDNELTRYAIKKAILNGKYTIQYISTILFNWKKNNITTVEQAQEDENKHRKKYEQKKYNPNQSLEDKLQMIDDFFEEQRNSK